MSLEINQRLLFVGLGGTGINAAIELESMLRKEMCGPDGTALVKDYPHLGLRPFELPRHIQTILIDTDDSAVKKHKSAAGIDNDDVYYSTSTLITDLSVNSSYKVVASGLRAQMPESVKDWLPSSDSEPNVSPISAGAGQYPLVGRASLFSALQPNAEAFLSNFDQAIERISKSSEELSALAGNASVAQEMYVYVAFSIAGGTGTGIYYDILHLLEEKIRREMPSLTLYMFPLVLMPQAFEDNQLPDAYKYSKINGGFAISDLAQLIDHQNAPSVGTESQFTQNYPGDLSISMGGSQEKRPVPLAFTFTKGPNADLDDMYKSVAAFCLSNIGGELIEKKNEKLTFFADLINRETIRQDDIAGPGLRPLVPAVAARLSIPVERISSLVSGYFVTSAIEESKSSIKEDKTLNVEAILKAAKLEFVSNQNTIPDNISLPRKPKTPSKSKDIEGIANQYIKNLKDYLQAARKEVENQVSERLSNINVDKIISDVLIQNNEIDIFEAFRALVGEPTDRSDSALEKIINFSQMTEPSDNLKKVRNLNKKKFDKWVNLVEKHVVNDVLPYYWANALIKDAQFSINITSSWQEEIDTIRRQISDWSDNHSTILQGAKAEISNQGELVKDFLPNIGTLNKTWDNLSKSFEDTAQLKDQGTIKQLTTVINQSNNNWSSIWTKVDGDYSKLGEIIVDTVNRPVSTMLSIGVKKYFDSDAKQSPLVPDLMTILESVKDPSSNDEIMSNSLDSLKSKVAGLIAPGGLPSNLKYEKDDNVNPVCRVTYPALQKDKVIEDWIQERLESGGAINAVKGITWEFTPSKGNSIVVSYVIMSQGILGNEDAQECIKATYESNINSPGADRVTFRRRLGTTSSNLIGTDNDEIKVLTRVLLSLYLNKGNFFSDSGLIKDSDFKNTTKFIYKHSENAPELTIPMQKNLTTNPIPTFMQDFLKFQLTANNDEVVLLSQMRGKSGEELPKELSEGEAPKPSNQFKSLISIKDKEITKIKNKIEKADGASFVGELKENLKFWQETLPLVLASPITIKENARYKTLNDLIKQNE